MVLPSQASSLWSPSFFQIIGLSFQIFLLITRLPIRYAILFGRVDTNGHQNGPSFDEQALSYIYEPDLLMDTGVSAQDLSAVSSHNSIKRQNERQTPEKQKTGQAKSVVHKIDMKDEEIDDGDGTVVWYNEEDTGKDDEKDEDSSSKQGKVVIRKIVAGKNGDLHGIDFYKDKGHKKHGWKNSYHKEEWGESKDFHDVLKDKDWKKKFKGFGSKGVKGLLGQTQVKKKKRFSNKGKNPGGKRRTTDETAKRIKLGSGRRLPEILLSFLNKDAKLNDDEAS